MVFFRIRLGKILIWQNFHKRESPTLKLNHFLLTHCSIIVAFEIVSVFADMQCNGIPWYIFVENYIC